MTCGDWLCDGVLLVTDEDGGREDVVREVGVVVAGVVAVSVLVLAVLVRVAVEAFGDEQPASRTEDDSRSAETSR